MTMNVKRGFNRLFAVLTPLWIVYCLVVYPIQRRARAEKIEKAEFQSCWQESNPPDFKRYTDYARLKAGRDMWTLRAFYSRESWVCCPSCRDSSALSLGPIRADAVGLAWLHACFVVDRAMKGPSQKTTNSFPLSSTLKLCNASICPSNLIL